MLHPANRPWQAAPMTLRRLACIAPLLAALVLPASPRAEGPPASEGAPAPGEAPGTATPLALGTPRLTVDLATAGVVTGVELGLIGLSLAFKNQLTTTTCRWCEPPQFDRWVRDELRWGNTQAASRGSDAMQLLVPLAAVSTLWIQAAPHGNREVVEDLVVLTESVSTGILATQVVKYAVGRLRPDAWARGTIQSPDDCLSFWSGHASFAFSTAAAATQIARLRGRPGWKWLGLATFSAAALTGYLRIAADRHWTTDVLASAVVGTTTGLVVPLLAFQPADARRSPVTLAPAPGGLALVF
jgi:membrane-associated phospholipid phosphatase